MLLSKEVIVSNFREGLEKQRLKQHSRSWKKYSPIYFFTHCLFSSTQAKLLALTVQVNETNVINGKGVEPQSAPSRLALYTSS